MKLSKKSLLLALSLMLALSMTAMGTIAYLTDTQKVENTFTSGKVDITVDETIVDEDGQPTDADEDGDGDPDNDRAEQGNEYHLVPGMTYVKDPTMTVKADSEPSYVRMRVVITSAKELVAAFDKHRANYPDGFIPEKHVTQSPAAKEGWIYNVAGYNLDEEANELTLEFRYDGIVDPESADFAGEGDVVLPALFDTFTLPGCFDNDDVASLENMKINVIGEAIQAAAFDTEDDAWTAFEAQHKDDAADDATGDDAGAQG